MSNVPTKYWHKLPNGKIQCDVCPRHCKLNEGQKGLCFVRARENDQIVSTTYGRSSGYCIDPIEKKPLNHFLPGSSVLSFGTAGCNLACKFCQNWDISKSKEMDILADSASPTHLADAAVNLGCKSVAFTYNDPIVFMEYAIDTAIACHERNIYTVAVTSGYMCPKPREEFYKHMDAANVDLKAFTEEFYKTLTGASLEPVLDTLKYIKKKTKTWLEITTLLIPGKNDSNAEINKMTKWIADNLGTEVPLHFSAFHPAWKMMDVPHTPTKTLDLARDIAMKNNLRYVYIGNVYNIEGGTTICHKCKTKLIIRDWYNILEYNLSADAKCPKCNTKCAGVFIDHADNWGGKRQPVIMHLGDEE